jgi:hypothetical protein
VKNVLTENGRVRYGTVRYATLLYATVRYGTLRYATVRYGTLRYATVRYGTLRYATVRYGVVDKIGLPTVMNIFLRTNFGENGCITQELLLITFQFSNFHIHFLSHKKIIPPNKLVHFILTDWLDQPLILPLLGC